MPTRTKLHPPNLHTFHRRDCPIFSHKLIMPGTTLALLPRSPSRCRKGSSQSFCYFGLNYFEKEDESGKSKQINFILPHSQVWLSISTLNLNFIWLYAITCQKFKKKCLYLTNSKNKNWFFSNKIQKIKTIKNLYSSNKSKRNFFFKKRFPLNSCTLYIPFKRKIQKTNKKTEVFLFQ